MQSFWPWHIADREQLSVKNICTPNATGSGNHILNAAISEYTVPFKNNWACNALMPPMRSQQYCEVFVLLLLLMYLLSGSAQTCIGKHVMTREAMTAIILGAPRKIM